MIRNFLSLRFHFKFLTKLPYKLPEKDVLIRSDEKIIRDTIKALSYQILTVKYSRIPGANMTIQLPLLVLHFIGCKKKLPHALYLTGLKATVPLKPPEKFYELCILMFIFVCIIFVNFFLKLIISIVTRCFCCVNYLLVH